MGLLLQLAELKPSHVVGLTLALAVSFVFAFVAQRLWFHPLAKYPGPLLGRLTNFYAGYHAWKGDLHLDMQRCHEKYGDFVRYNPNRLLVNSVTGMRSIYSHKSEFQKAQGYNVMVHRAPNTLTYIDKKGHGRKRRIVSQGLSEAAIRSYEPIIMECINKFCDILGQPKDAAANEKAVGQWSDPKNMAKLNNYLTFDIMSGVIFGEKFDLLEKPDNRFVPEAIEASNVRTSVLIQADKLLINRFDKKLFKSAIMGRNRFLKFVTQLLQTRLTSKSLMRADAFSWLLKATDPETGESMSAAELGAEATTLVVAGSDTSSTALSGLFFYLSRYPAALARASAEVRKAFPADVPVKLGPELTSCAFLSACIDEAMRLCPPAATALWRECTAPTVLDGQNIPAGVNVGTCIFAIHHNEAYFPQPYEFMPERWLAENRTHEAQQAFCPFSVGPRSCVGKGLGRAELMLAGAEVLRRFDFETAPGLHLVGAGNAKLGPGRERPEEYQIYDHITCVKDGPMLRFRPRPEQEL